MKLHFFGTCAGTEPMPQCHHMSFAIESYDKIYWFDAGENCSYTAHNMGVDLLAVEKVFISHTHMDHVGGLGNLFWNIRKMTQMTGKNPVSGNVDLYIPNIETWNGIYMMLKNTEGNFECDMEINAIETVDGVICDDGTIKVTAFHNNHVAHNEGEPWRAFSYKIECEGKEIVYSGDVGGLSDLDELSADGCDVLIMETGHHKVAEVAGYFNGRGVKNLFFSHNGREILYKPVEMCLLAQSLFDGNVLICEDKMTVEM